MRSNPWTLLMGRFFDKYFEKFSHYRSFAAVFFHFLLKIYNILPLQFTSTLALTQLVCYNYNDKLYLVITEDFVP